MFGIPQGSILGSVLLHTYICDIFYDSDDLDFVNFADENTPYFCLSDMISVLGQLKGVIDKIFDWFKKSFLNPIQDGLFRGCSRIRGAFWPPVPKICHTYPTMMKLGTVIPYLRKIQKIYKSRDTSLEFC